MACRRIEKYLIPYAESALSEDMRRAVEEHISVCAACAQELANITRTVSVLKSVDIPAMEPAHDLRSRVLAQIADKPVRKPWWKSSVLPAYSGAIAMIIVAVLVVQYEPYTKTKQNAMPPTPAPKAETRSADDQINIIQAKPNTQTKAPKIFGRANNNLSFLDGHVATPKYTPKAPVTAGDRVSAYNFNESDRWESLPKNTIKPSPDYYDKFTQKPDSLVTDPYLGVPEGNAKSMSQGGYGGGRQPGDNKLDSTAKPEVPFQRDTMAANASVPGGMSLSGSYGGPAGPSAPAASSAPPAFTFTNTYSDADSDSVRSKNERGGYGNTFSTSDTKGDMWGEENKDKEADGKILLLERRLRQFPNSRTVLEDLLVAYRSAGRTQDEYSITERMTKLAPDNPSYWFARAQAAEKIKLIQTAVKSYERAINLKLTQPQLDLAKSRIDALKK